MAAHALGQYLRALAKDPARAEMWAQALGHIDRVGSRAPTGHPAWVTQRVLSGGFAMGPKAGGELADWEREQMSALGFESRRQMNEFFLSSDGLAMLGTVLEERRYACELVEEAALLSVVAELRAQRPGVAEAIVEAIAPFLGELRFYPHMLQQPAPASLLVSAITNAELQRVLRSAKDRPKVMVHKRVCDEFYPLYQELLGIAADTRDLSSGTPFARPPDRKRWRQWETAFKGLRVSLCTKRMRRGSFGKLSQTLAKAAGGKPVSLRERGLAAVILASAIAKRGLPGSPGAAHCLDCARRPIALFVPRGEWAGLVCDRASVCPASQGLDVDIAHPVTAEEAAVRGIRANLELPAFCARAIARATQDTLEGHIKRGVIKSSETMVPLASAMVAAAQAGDPDPVVAHLTNQFTCAFMRRRSLLLTNYETQVKMSEVPWCPRPSACVERPIANRLVAQQLVRLHITHWPDVTIPNKLVSTLQLLLIAAGVDLHLTEEVAADIFMGGFSRKFAEAGARVLAAGELKLYPEFYGLPSADIPTNAQSFNTLCEKIAGMSRTSRASVSGNGAVIEACAILTTSNLYDLLAQGFFGTEHVVGAAENCLTRAVQLTAHETAMSNWQTKKSRVKAAAFAWRQLVFYLSVSGVDVAAWCADAAKEVHGHSAKVWHGQLSRLKAVAEGRSSNVQWVRGWKAQGP